MIPVPTLRQLRYLLAVAEHRHFGRAAEACFVAQPTLSAGIRELEDLLGVRLIERTRRKVVITALGERVIERARRALAEAEAIAELAAAEREPLTGELRLGVIPTIGPFLLPKRLPELRRAYPDLRLYLREDLTERLLDALADGVLDLLLLALPYEAEGVRTRALADDPFLVACPPDHPFARMDSVPRAALADAPLLLLEDGHCLRAHALDACQLSGARHGKGLEATSLHTLVQMVANGLGITLLPRLALDADILRGTDLVVRPIRGSGAARQIGLAWRATSAREHEFELLGDALQQALTR